MEIFEETKIIWSYLRKYKKRVWKLSVLAMIASGILAFIPYFYGRLVDLVSIKSTDFSFVFALLGIWVVMSVTSAFLYRFVGSKGGDLGVDCFSDLVCESASHIINLPFSFHNDRKTGEIFSKIQRAADYLFRIIDDILFWFFPQFFSVLVGVLILLFVKPQLAIGIVVLLLGYVLITIFKTLPIVENQEKLNKSFEKSYGNLYDSFSNIQLIKSCAAENFQDKRTNQDFKEKLGIVFKKFLMSWYSLHLWQDVFFAFAFVFIFGSAIVLLGRGLISPGKLIMFLGYLNMVRSPLKALGFQWRSFKTGITTIKRVRTLLETETEDYKENGKILEEPKGKVEFKNVSFGYKEKALVLNKVSFVSLPGKKIALVGGSGEGKTTLVNLISLYFRPDKGKIFLDDVNIQDLNLHFLRKIIAYVPQEISLFNDTIRNNIRYGKPDAVNEDIIAAAKAANAHKFIESFPKKYNSLVGERGIKLSTGQKQRIAIARALIRDPKILILDEATSSLDSESEKLVHEALENLIKERTTFIVAHRLSTIRKADKILVLKKGKIVERGTHKELIKKRGAYFNFYSLQFDLKK